MGRAEKIIAASGTLVAVGGGLVSSLVPTVIPAYAGLAFWGGLAIVAIGLALLVWALLRREEGATTMGDNYTNNGSNFGHMGPVNNYAPKPFELTDTVIAGAVAQISGTRKVEVTSYGPSQEIPPPLARNFVNALIALGYDAQLVNHVSNPSVFPEKGIGVTKSNHAALVTLNLT